MRDEETPLAPLEDLLADWFAGAVLVTQPLASPESESAYIAHLAALYDAHRRGRAIARKACLRLTAGLEATGPPLESNAPAPRSPQTGAHAMWHSSDAPPAFELSI